MGPGKGWLLVKGDPGKRSHLQMPHTPPPPPLVQGCCTMQLLRVVTREVAAPSGDAGGVEVAVGTDAGGVEVAVGTDTAGVIGS